MIQPPDQHHVDLTTSCRSKQLFPELKFDHSGTNLFDLKRDRPPALRGVRAHGVHLQGQSLLVVRGHTRIQSNPKHFRRRLSLAENPLRYCCCGSPFDGHFRVPDLQGFKL